jgi:glutamate synthase domain-containing protein 3
LDDWSPSTLASFVKVMPTDYKRVLEAKKQKELEASNFAA